MEDITKYFGFKPGDILDLKISVAFLCSGFYLFERCKNGIVYLKVGSIPCSIDQSFICFFEKAKDQFPNEVEWLVEEQFFLSNFFDWQINNFETAYSTVSNQDTYLNFEYIGSK
ncbi:MAG: hypothetical protein SGJ02_06185 [bacterium]|nr:hypothetical protein [bacterium]